MLGLSLIVGYVLSVIVCGFMFFKGVHDPNDLCVIWFTVYGPWTAVTYLAGMISSPREFSPTGGGQGSLWTIFMIQGALLPVMALIYGMPQDGVFALVQIWMGFTAVAGFLFVLVGVGGYVLSRVRVGH